jgi:hypothetical protein
MAEPTPVARPAPPRISQNDRDGLANLAARATEAAETPAKETDRPVGFAVASLGPAFRPPMPRPAETMAMDTSRPPARWVTAPAWDEEHPEELSYRPFAITPLIGDDGDLEPRALTELRAPDIIRALEAIDQGEHALSLPMAQGRQVTGLLAAQNFRGAAVALDSYFARRGQ